MSKFSQRLLELRKEKDLSQKRLAQQLGISDSIICLWENDKSEITYVNLEKLADFFGVTTDYLLGRSDY